MRSLAAEWSYLIIRLILGSVFFYAGASKLFDTQGFATVISGYGLLPDSLTFLAAIALPVVEIIIAAALVWDVKGSLSIYSLLLLVFMGVLAHGINMGLDVDCGCFAPGDPEAEAYHSLREAFFRDLVLLAGCVSLYWLRMVNSYSPRPLFAIFSKS
ncbi:MAG: DoxX family protein [Desulfovibrio sp. S3730MH75]|nr:MAG: DoxX family protein [Desulfovibrio sp. S3730MH75]